MSSNWFVNEPYQISKFGTRSSADLTFYFGRYSFAHLLQTIWLYAWATLYILRHVHASGIKGSANTGCPNRKWLGVIASRSSGSSLTRVKGLAFSVCSTKHIVVVNTGNVRRLFPRISNMAFLQLRTSLSQIPRKCRAPAGLNFQMIWSRANRSYIASRSHWLKHSWNSRAAPTKFVTLSLMIVWGLPRLAMILVTAILHESVSRALTTSKWTVPVTKHVNKQHHNNSASLVYAEQ